MSIDAEMIVWQSWTGKWNVGVSPDQDWARSGSSRFSYLETGFATEDEAMRVNTGCGGASIHPFEPHERAHNDRYDVEAQAFGQPYKGPWVVVDQDALDRQALVEAEQDWGRALDTVDRVLENYPYSPYRQEQLRGPSAEADRLGKLVRQLKAKVRKQGAPQGPFYTPEMLAHFQASYAEQARSARSEAERKNAKQIASFYNKLFTKTSKARQIPSAAPGASPGAVQPRKPRGVPVGGQWATRERGDTGDLS